MSPSITVLVNEVNQAAGAPGATGTAFIPAVTDGAPITAPTYVKCQAITDFTNNFGPRSSTSATAYDWLDEYFHDGGQVAYVTRVTDNTATAATLTLNDAVPHPTVVVTASPGTFGNALYTVVTRGTGVVISGYTTNSSVTVTGVTSFAGIGVGTPVSAATGIPANAYVATVTPASSTLTLSASANATGTQAITPATFTTTIQDVNGNAYDTHGPYYTTAQLIADTTSTVVAFSQSAGGGNTTNVPVALSATALTGGGNANDLTVTSSVNALANFAGSLGPGQVAIPGYANTTAWSGLLSHAQAKNRFALLDLPDNSSASSVVSNFGTITTNSTYGMATEGSLVLPGILPNTTRTVAASAAVAALCAQVAATPNQNQVPCGMNWPLTYPISFTEYNGPGGTYLSSDVQTMSAAGINCFSVFNGVPCLFGFVTPTPLTTDITFWQASATRERMALVYDSTIALGPFLFDIIDGGNKTLIAAQSALQAVISNHWNEGALYGDTASDAGAVNMGPPINTPTTEAAGQLNANMQVRISPYANTINESITTVPISLSVS